LTNLLSDRSQIPWQHQRRWAGTELLVYVLNAQQVRAPEGISLLRRCDSGPMTIIPELIAKTVSMSAATGMQWNDRGGNRIVTARRRHLLSL
jgi:hypothetical protein